MQNSPGSPKIAPNQNQPKRDDNVTHEKVISIKSQMENFREKALERRVSCPLVIANEEGTKFQIYDKQFR